MCVSFFFFFSFLSNIQYKDTKGIAVPGSPPAPRGGGSAPGAMLWEGGGGLKGTPISSQGWDAGEMAYSISGVVSSAPLAQQCYFSPR